MSLLRLRQNLLSRLPALFPGCRLLSEGYYRYDITEDSRRNIVIGGQASHYLLFTHKTHFVKIYIPVPVYFLKNMAIFLDFWLVFFTFLLRTFFCSVFLLSYKYYKRVILAPPPRLCFSVYMIWYFVLILIHRSLFTSFGWSLFSSNLHCAIYTNHMFSRTSQILAHSSGTENLYPQVCTVYIYRTVYVLRVGPT